MDCPSCLSKDAEIALLQEQLCRPRRYDRRSARVNERRNHELKRGADEFIKHGVAFDDDAHLKQNDDEEETLRKQILSRILLRFLISPTPARRQKRQSAVGVGAARLTSAAIIGRRFNTVRKVVIVEHCKM